MKKTLAGLVIVAIALTAAVTPLRAASKVARERLSERVHTVNDTAKSPEMKQVAYRTISNETGVPLAEVESMHKRYTDAGPAGIMMACVMADDTKKAPEDFLKSRQSGKSWDDIARDNKISLDKLSARLDRLENAMTTGTDKAKRRH
jgi:hypothetical protein